MEDRRRGGKPGRVAAGIIACVLAATAAGQWIDEAPGYVPLVRLVPGAMPIGTTIVTEGFYGGRIDGAVVLSGCPVVFLVGPDTEVEVDFPRLTSRNVLRIEGVAAYLVETQTYYVNAKSIKPAPDAKERVLAALNDSNLGYEKLVAVGKWAKERSADYRDERLSELADAVFIKALKAEDVAMSATDYEGYFQLAKRSEELLGRPLWKEYYVRQGIDAYILSHGKPTPQVYYDAARKAEEHLPNSVLPEILIQQGFEIESGGRDEKKASDYFQLAARAKEIFGEGLHYRRLLTKAFDLELAKIDRSDYTALYNLARQIKDVYPSYPNYRTLVTQAISSEKDAMDVRDSQAWMRLGNRILYLLEDKFQAGAAFRRAAGLDPTNVEVRTKLVELGYVYYQGSWWLSDEFGESAVVKNALELEKMAAAGEVAVGMTSEQVMTAKKAMPQETYVSAGGWGVTTQWVYRDEDKATYLSFMADRLVSKGEATE